MNFFFPNFFYQYFFLYFFFHFLKSPETYARKMSSKLEQRLFFAPMLINFVLHTFQMILKKILKKKYTIFFIYLESSETHFDLVTCKIGANLNLSLKIFVEKSSKLEIKILLNEKIKNKSKNCFCIRFRTLRIFWDQKLNLSSFGMRGSACRSLEMSQ